MGNSPAQSQRIENMMKKFENQPKQHQKPRKRSLSSKSNQQKKFEPLGPNIPSKMTTHHHRNKSQTITNYQPVSHHIHNHNQPASPLPKVPHNPNYKPTSNPQYHINNQNRSSFYVHQGKSPSNYAYQNGNRLQSPQRRGTPTCYYTPRIQQHTDYLNYKSNTHVLGGSQIYQTKILRDSQIHRNQSPINSRVRTEVRQDYQSRSVVKGFSPQPNSQPGKTSQYLTENIEKSQYKKPPKQKKEGFHLKEVKNKDITLESEHSNKQIKKMPSFIQERSNKSGKNNNSTKLPYFSMFEASPRDDLPLDSRKGVPTIDFSPKTKIDTHQPQQKMLDQDTKNQTLKKREKINNTQNSFMKKHLLFSNKMRVEENYFNHQQQAMSKNQEQNELCSYSSQNSFGNTLSEDSEPQIEGSYSGETHPSFPKMKHGNGRLVFPSGGSYQGNFAYNKMDGYGKLFYPSGRLAYEGYWKNNKFNGYGKLFNEFPQYIEKFDYRDFSKIQKLTNSELQNGYWKLFEGNMKNDMKEGSGIWILENGQRFQGEFKADCVHGQGTFYSKTGVIEGRWNQNILVKINKEDKNRRT